MTRILKEATLAAMLLGATGAMFGATAARAAVEDATIVDPEAHQVMFENEHVRVLRVLAAHGHKSRMHSHPPLLVVSLGTGRVRMTLADGTKLFLDLSPGQAFWLDATEHSWELLAGEVNIVAVEVKAANDAMDAAARSAR